MWVTYILCCSDNSLYTGITNNLEKRIETHNKKRGAKYTRTRTPVTLKAYWRFPNKSEAAKEEYRIKQLKRSQKLEMIKYWSKS